MNIYCEILGNLSWILYGIWCSPPVRRASANVVSIIAKYAVPAGEWPDLLPFLFQCSQSAQEEHREVSCSFCRILERFWILFIVYHVTVSGTLFLILFYHF